MSRGYTISVTFNTDRELTPTELDQLVNAVAVQVEDPAGLDGDKRASFTVWGVDVSAVGVFASGVMA